MALVSAGGDVSPQDFGGFCASLLHAGGNEMPDIPV
jgi:hypothetical protein